MQNVNPKIDESWKRVLSSEFSKGYFSKLKVFLQEEQKNYTIYPKDSDIFNAYNSTSFYDVKVVILGQDPYHGMNQAHGLSFSVQDGVAFPPSLKNIFSELVNDIGCPYPSSGNLSSWASQGVFLLNTVLTVRASEVHSHKNKGWEYFTDATIRAISDNLENVVFILWGNPAQQKIKFIDKSKHKIVTSVHPSPLSAYRDFFGSLPFSKANAYLVQCGKIPIDWCLS